MADFHSVQIRNRCYVTVWTVNITTIYDSLRAFPFFAVELRTEEMTATVWIRAQIQFAASAMNKLMQSDEWISRDHAKMNAKNI